MTTPVWRRTGARPDNAQHTRPDAQGGVDQTGFSRDISHFPAPDVSDEFPGPTIHGFLIRDHARSIPSIFRPGPDWVVAEYGVEEHRRLFDRIAGRDGKVPPVADSDDLLENPEGVVSAWRKAAGITFIPDALS
ncbi:MAG: hypothetical protein GDA53_03415 [Rhodobacteraceae bacterium]|nr:hypothetical protein [Paracoccaceae bacterium]